MTNDNSKETVELVSSAITETASAISEADNKLNSEGKNVDKSNLFVEDEEGGK